MTTRSIAPCIVATLLAALAGCSAAPAEPTAVAAAAIAGGVESQRGAVVAVINPDELCSAQLLTPDLVLTARHCAGPVVGGTYCGPVDGGSGPAAPTGGEPFAAGDVIVVLDAFVPAFPNEHETVAEVITLPGSTGGPLCGNDLALLRLASPVTNVEPIVPRLDLPPLVGEPFVAVGYGQTGGNDVSTAGTRREIADRKVTDVDEVASSSGQLRTVEGEWIADQGPCFGDSGGPAIDGEGRSFGVMSRGAGALCTKMIYGGLAPHAAWLREAALASAKARGVAPPAWTTPPAAGAAGFGEPCASADQCAAGLVCRPLAGAYRCTSLDCEHCPEGATCGDSLGVPACVPAVEAGADAGADASPEADPPPEEPGTAPADEPGAASSGGCAAGRSQDASAAAGLAALVALAASRRRRRG